MTNYSRDEIDLVKNALTRLGLIGAKLKDDEFYTMSYVTSSEDEMALTTLYSPKHFRTADGLAKAVADEITGDGYRNLPKELDEVRELIEEDFHTDGDSEPEVGLYFIEADGFSD